MNGEKCVLCGKPMGNSAQEFAGNPAHSHCIKEAMAAKAKMRLCDGFDCSNGIVPRPFRKLKNKFYCDDCLIRELRKEIRKLQAALDKVKKECDAMNPQHFWRLKRKITEIIQEDYPEAAVKQIPILLSLVEHDMKARMEAAK